MEHQIQVRRVYDPPGEKEGARFLVERLWPRGIRKEALRLTGWLKEAAPSSELRKWFAHDPAKWGEFRKRYIAELRGNPEGWKPLLEAAGEGNITLLFSARDEEHNSAVVLREFLQERMKAHRHRDRDRDRS